MLPSVIGSPVGVSKMNARSGVMAQRMTPSQPSFWQEITRSSLDRNLHPIPARADETARLSGDVMIRTALIILADCPDGATEHALKLRGITHGAMATLTRNGLARVGQQTVGTHTASSSLVFKVDRYWITEKGKRTLEIA